MSGSRNEPKWVTPAVYVMVGAPGSGKTTICEWLDRNGVHVRWSADEARAAFGDHEGDQSATPRALAYVVSGVIGTIRAGLPVVVDTTCSRAAERAVWLGVADAHQVHTVAVVVRTPLEVCHERNQKRTPNRRVPEDVVDAMWQRVDAVNGATLRVEGFDEVWNVDGLEAVVLTGS